MPEHRLQRCREAYSGGDSVADAFRGRWCDDCQKRVAMVVPDDDGGFRPFDGEHDVIAFCKHCHGWLGVYFTFTDPQLTRKYDDDFSKATNRIGEAVTAKCPSSAAYRITQAQKAHDHGT